MTTNKGLRLNELYREYLEGKIDRRTLLQAASGIGMSAAGFAMFSNAITASAQSASPEASPMAGGATPEASYPVVKSTTRDEYKAALKAWWKEYEEPKK